MSTSHQTSTLQWEELSELMADFIEAWEESPTPPNIARFLTMPASVFRGTVAVELIKIDLEQRYSRGETPRLERYSADFPEILQDGHPPCDLIYEEFHLRKKVGDEPDPEDYFRRFPQCKPVLARLLNCGPSHETTSLAEKIPPVKFNVGETVEDFTLIAHLGSGAFANVYLARQISMQRLVALKISTKKSNEPETLAQLEHPFIVRVFDQRQLPEKKLILLYMQFAPGGTLREVIELSRSTPASERSGSLLLQAVDQASERSGYAAVENSTLRRRLSSASWPEVVCRIGSQLALALDFAHKRGVLHRDVKPANVLLSAECTPKLADFNTSFASQVLGATPGAFFGGSLAYMSPEQLEAFNPENERLPDSLDGRTDLFSLSALLWEMLYGQRPFREDELSERWPQLLKQMVERRHSQRPVPPERNNRQPLQAELSRVLLRGMQPKPEDRPRDGAEFARELLLCLAPKSRFLVEIPKFGWRRLVRAWPMAAIIVLVLLPNALGALFNYLYLRGLLLSIGDHALVAFGQVSFVLNVVYFSVGAVVAKVIVNPLAQAVVTSTHQGKIAPDQALEIRLRSLRLGDQAAVIGICLWLSSGVVFPMSIQALTPEFEMHHYLNFLASMTICGLISAAYPFFGLTFVLVRVLYPALLRVAPGTDSDEAGLLKLEGNLFKYLFAAGIVPLASMLMVVLMDVNNRYVILGLILSGLAGLAVTYALYQKIREDIAALLVTVRPLEGLGTETDSRATY